MAKSPAVEALIKDMAGTIAAQAAAIHAGTLTGPRYAAIKNLRENADTLLAWVSDENPSKITRLEG